MKKFQFSYPVTNFKVMPAKHIGDLIIDGDFEKAVDTTVRKITFFKKATIITDDIQEIIEIFAPDVYLDIQKAAIDHVKGLIEKEKSLV